MTLKAFLVDALSSALDLGIGTPDDVIRHVTPDILATHLPRPLWARMFTACLGASRVDAQLIVETVGVPNLVEHIPSSIIWSCIHELGARSLGKSSDEPVVAAPSAAPTVAVAATGSRPNGVAADRPAVLAPPPDERPAPPPQPAPLPVAGPSIPPLMVTGPESLAEVISEIEQTDGEPRLATLRPRSPTAQRFRQSNTAATRIGTARRPQAAAQPTPTSTPIPTSSGRPRREPTEVEDPETQVGDGEWRNSGVDDSQLVDWQADGPASSAATTDEDFSDLGRKR